MTARLRLALPALLVLVTVVTLSFSWNRWLDPIIDTGRDLYISEQLAHGTKLYRDVRYQYPPLAPYLLAALTSVIGSSLAAFTAIGLAQSLVIAALLWLAVRNTAGLVAALLFLSLSFTGASTWGANFVFPYSYAATLGVALLLGALVAFLRGRHTTAVALLAAASWMKIEYAIGAAFIVVVLTVARRVRIAHAAAYLGAMTASAAVAFGYFGQPLIDNVFAASLTKGQVAQDFFRYVSGLSEWPRNGAIALAGAAAIAAIAWLSRTRPAIAWAALAVAAIAFTSDSFFRGWGVLQLVALVAGFRDRESPLIYFAAFSIAATLRVPLNTTPQWYGCVLIVPLYALAAHVLFVELPARGAGHRLWLLVVVLLCARDVFQQTRQYEAKVFPITTERGTFYDWNPDRAAVINEMLPLIRGETLAVMPEGVTINYLTRRKTPLTFHMFTPPETAEPRMEQAVLSELRQRPPDQVAVVDRDVREYGFGGFGVDYNRALAAYLFQNYEVTRAWRPARFRAILLTRKRPSS